MHGHLVAVKVSVERGADQWVELNGASVYEHGPEGLYPEPVQGRGTVQQHGPLLGHLFQDVPDLGPGALHHPLGALYIVRQPLHNQPLHHKGFEQFQGHPFRQTALVQPQVGPDDDHGSPTVVDSLAQEVLPEPSLLPSEHVR